MSESPRGDGSERVRVLRVFSRLNVGGPSVHVILLTSGLRARGYDTRLVVGRESVREGNMRALAAERGVVCEDMPGLGRAIAPLQDLRALLGLHRLVRSFRPAVVHTHTAKAGVLGRLAARAAGVPVVVHTFHGHVLRGYFGPVKTAAFRRLEERLASWADVLVAVSPSVRDDLVALGVARPDQIRVVPVGLELAHLAGPLPRGVIRRELGLGPAVPLVGMIGRLVPIKDVPTFLQAAVEVRKARPEVHFVLVGDGEERPRQERRVQRLGAAGFVSFLGWRRDLEAVYGDVDVVVNASLNEGTPVALIEALAAGRPVVATRVGGTVDLLGDDERGCLVPPRDPEALAAAILGTLRDPEAARGRAEIGRGYVLARHASSRLVDDVDRLYRELLARRGVAA